MISLGDALMGGAFYVVGTLILDWSLFGQLRALRNIAESDGSADYFKESNYLRDTNWWILIPLVSIGAVIFALSYILKDQKTVLLLLSFGCFMTIAVYRYLQRKVSEGSKRNKDAGS
jgi:uncharacterized membrane protein